jgi:hypothetical protein
MHETGSTYQSQLEDWQAHHSFTEDEEDENDWAQEIVHISWKPRKKFNLLILSIASEMRLHVVNRALPRSEWINREELISSVAKKKWNIFIIF